MARIALALLTVGVAALFTGCGGPSNPTAATPPPSPPADPPSGVPDPSFGQQKPPRTDPTEEPAKPTGASVKGAITHPAAKGQKLTVGYVELTGDEWVGDALPHAVPAADVVERVESDHFKPRVAALAFDKGATTFEFTGLPAGTYLLFARIADGPTAWAKVEVAAGATVTRDLKAEVGKGGTAEVTVPADYTGEVRLAPNDLIPAEDAVFVGGRIATQLELGGKAKGGKVVIPDVPPGKYTLFVFPGKVVPRGGIEVTAGKTASAELEAEKK
jgi:hypothetical protein